jgi:nucleotide-binding universal stress UspA family protein
MELTKTVVVGVDGSDCSRDAVRWAADEAVRRDARLKLVHVWQYSPAYLVPTADIIADAGAALSDAARIARDRGAQVAAMPIEGSPVHMLVRESRDAEMLVLGSYGQGRISDIFFGSISRGCIRHAMCPIVIIPAALKTKLAFTPLPTAKLGAAPLFAQLGVSID